MSWYRDQLERWLSTISITKARRVLDIGGADNPIANGRLAIFQNIEMYLILDLIQVPDNNYECHFFDLNIPYDQQPFKDKFHGADHIFCLEVFEYIYDPLTALRNIHTFLHPDGFAYVSWPTNYPLHNPVENDCLRYTHTGIKKLIDAARLEIVEDLPRVPYPESRGIMMEFWKREAMHPARGTEEVFDIGYLTKIRRKP